MDREFWQRRWSRGQISFHREQVNPHLLEHADKLFPVGAPVLLPLCGKSLDLAWLAARGNPVVGVEFNALAVNQFFSGQGLEPDRTPLGKFECFTSGQLKILLGDFFSLEKEQVSACHRVFDRAALVALDAPSRRAYVNHLLEVMPRPLELLLVTFEYRQEQMQGPPFSVTGEEIRKLYAGGDIKLLGRENISPINPRWRDAGLVALDEAVYHIRIH